VAAEAEQIYCPTRCHNPEDYNWMITVHTNMAPAATSQGVWSTEQIMFELVTKWF